MHVSVRRVPFSERDSSLASFSSPSASMGSAQGSFIHCAPSFSLSISRESLSACGERRVERRSKRKGPRCLHEAGHVVQRCRFVWRGVFSFLRTRKLGVNIGGWRLLVAGFTQWFQQITDWDECAESYSVSFIILCLSYVEWTDWIAN